MKKFLKKQREFIAVTLFFLVLGVVGYFAVVPLLKKITATKDAIEENKIKQEMKKQRLQELPKIAQQYDEVNRQQKKIDILLDKQQAVVLIERLEGLAQETNNKIQIVAQEDPQSKKTAESKSKTAPKVIALIDTLPRKDYLKLKVTLTGDYNGVLKFIHSLESLEHYADIIELNIGQVVSDKQTASISKLGTDSVNPFDSQAGGQSDPAVVGSGQLEAVLTVVFYSKN